jgi:hypothetical protein
MKMKTEILVSSDIIIRIRETGEEQHLTVDNIPCTWVWSDGSRAAMEYWVVVDWIVDTFGDSIDWFGIKWLSGSPRSSLGEQAQIKEGEE